MNVYGVIESSYEYDDERYNEGSGYYVKTLYKSKERAIEECDKLLYEFYKETDMSSYAYSLSDFLTDRGREIIAELAPLAQVHTEVSTFSSFDDVEDMDFENYLVAFQTIVRSIDLQNLKDLFKEIQISPYEVREFIMDSE